MKQIFRMLSLLLATTMLTACLRDDDESVVTTYGDMMIQSFTLGTLNRYQTLTSAVTGNDTTVKTTYAGSAYPMTIDHIGGRIYNQTPLPVGTDNKHVVCTITTKNNGVVYLKLLDRDSLYYHNSADSVDLSVDRIFRVYAINGTGHRDYTVHLDVSEFTGTHFDWQYASRPDTGIGDGELDASRLIRLGESMLLLARQQGHTTVYYAATDGETLFWQTADDTTLDADAWQNAVSKGDSALYVLSGRQLLCTTDAAEWTTMSDDAPIARLVAASSSELYALSADGTMMCSADNGHTWQADSLEYADDAPLMPTDSLATICWPYAGSDNAQCVLMAGLRQDTHDGNMLIWRKICQNDATGSKGRWTYMPYDDNNPYRLPRAKQPSIVSYEGTLLAIGGDQRVYQSRDQGLSWRPNSTYRLPVTSMDMQYTMATDADGNIWLSDSTGQIWIGHMR